VSFFEELKRRNVFRAGAARYDEDPQVYTPDASGSISPFPDRLLLEAMTGDPERARALADRCISRPGTDAFTSLVAAAAVGHREAVDTAAARMDARPGGTFVLLQAAQMCFCGAPFDL
jgi:hypothetical protein